jgi:hypothetical protein
MIFLLSPEPWAVTTRAYPPDYYFRSRPAVSQQHISRREYNYFE